MYIFNKKYNIKKASETDILLICHTRPHYQQPTAQPFSQTESCQALKLKV
jgi:hypothetical protein